MAEGQDERLQQIVERLAVRMYSDDDVLYLLARLDALTAERDAARAWSARWKDCARGLRRSARQHYESWLRACDDISALSADLDRTEAERDALRARAERAEAALFPCTLALEYRDGVTCREERDKGVCLNHRVIAGLRVHAVTADRLEIENRALRRQVRATYGIIHEGLHGGKATDPEHQELCERPACRNARAALAGSREQAATTTEGGRDA